ncbi:MAG: tetratricopeptide repeat protein [Candidatus Thorarchaeota archaeon]
MNSEEIRDKAQRHQSKGINLANNGDLEGGLTELNLALELYDALDDKYLMINQLMLIGWVKRTQGELDQALEIFFKQLDLSKELNDKMQIYTTMNSIAYTYYYKGDLVLAEKNANESLNYYKEFKDTNLILSVDIILGSISSARGDYDEGLNRYKKFLEIFDQQIAFQEEVSHGYCVATRDIGVILFYQNKISEAIVYFKKAERIHKSICLFRNTFFDYELLILHLYLISSSLITNDEKQIAKSLEELSQFAKKWPWTELFWKVGKAYVLSTKERLKDKMQAQQLFEEVLKEKFDYQLEFTVQYNLCNLLLEELKYSGIEEILLEIQDLLSKISEATTKQRSIYTLVILYYLQAKLALVEGNAEFANELLIKGLTLAKAKGIGFYVLRLKSLQDKLFTQLGEWKELLTRNSRLQEKVELLNLKNDLTEAITDVLEKKFMTELDPLKLEDEDPTLLLILGGGVQIFSYPFTDEEKFNNELLGSFITAFNSFSDEAFSEALDRAKFGEYTFVMEPIESFSVCYLFKGQPYVARQKLIKFIKGIRKNTSIMEKLNKFNQTNQIIKVNDSPALESLIGEIFIIQ